MTHVERLGRISTPRLASRPPTSRWILSALAAVAVSLSTVAVPSLPAGAMTIAQEKQRAADLYTQIQHVSAQAQVLGQKYDLARLKYAQIVNTIVNTKAIVAGIQGQVATDNSRLKADAIFAYVTNGSAASNNPLFNTNAAAVGATDVYNQLATGNIGSVIASLKTNRVQLTQERGVLTAEMAQAAAVAAAAKASYEQSLTLQANIEAARHQVEGQISAYYNAIQAAAAAASARAVTVAAATPPSPTVVAPPPSSLGAAAVAAAESFLGVWYQWGGASRSGVDCSGLVMLAYQAVGVSLPHYSGAQFDDTVRVPLSDIQPGDLLFYGYNGDEHVAMYVGGGNMIEAPETGYQVRITPIRLGWGFAGIGRVRA